MQWHSSLPIALFEWTTPMQPVGSCPTVLVRHTGHDLGTAPVGILATEDGGDQVSATLERLDVASDRPGLVVAVGPATRAPGWRSAATYRRLEPVPAEAVPAEAAPAEPVPAEPVPVEAGTYRFRVVVDEVVVHSEPFVVAPHRTAASTIADLTAYFRSQRSSGAIDRKDRAASFWGDPDRPPVDASGGWLDASGDVSKFVSHLTYTRTMSPQQIPLCAWALLTAARELPTTRPDFRTSQIGRLRDEGLHGADFLLRFREPGGTFYTGVFDALTKRLDERFVTAPLQDSVRTDGWRAGYRHGAGVAIAALALASTAEDHGDAAPSDYLAAADEAFAYLEAHNASLLPDGIPNVVDTHCALLGAAELALARIRRDRPVDDVVSAVRGRVDDLEARLASAPTGAFLVADDQGAPYHSAVESGLPVIALVRAAAAFRAAGDEAAAVRAERLGVRIAEGIAERTDATPNPFGLVRQRTQPEGGEPRDAFFFPHRNETGYWWQGENANLGSVAVAASWIARAEVCPPAVAGRLRRLADDQVSWVLGRNPFDVCMLQGRGRGWFEYSGEYQNSPGGILNGITSGWTDEDDVALAPAEAPAGEEWRWAEQWIPHTGWFVLAVATSGGIVAHEEAR